MLFVALLNAKTTTTRMNSIPRRAEWKWPEGLKYVAEYWLQHDNPRVICVAEADSIGPIMAAVAAWDDLFDISVFPAVTAEEGLKLASQMMSKGS